MTTPMAAGNTPPPTGGHPPGCYYVNIVNGAIQRQCNPIAIAGLAFAGYFGCDGLPAVPENACPTFAAAKAFANAHSVTGNASGFFGQILMPFNAIGNFFGMLTSRQTLIRIGEGVLGIALIIVGTKYVLEHSETVKATVENIQKGATTSTPEGKAATAAKAATL